MRDRAFKMFVFITKGFKMFLIITDRKPAGEVAVNSKKLELRDCNPDGKVILKFKRFINYVSKG